MSEDEPEARLKVAEEVDRLGSAEREWIRRGGILVALLSDHDVFQNFILPKLSRGDVSMLTRVNRACRNGVREMVDQALGWKLSVKDFVVSPERFKWARANGCPWIESTCSIAAREGHLEALQWARANGCPWKSETSTLAAKGGHLEVLQWARANGCPWDWATCRAAAGGGHLDVLQWARANGCPWDEHTCSAAAEGGHLEVLQWARANGCPWDEDTCASAAGGGHLEVLQWARANG